MRLGVHMSSSSYRFHVQKQFWAKFQKNIIQPDKVKGSTEHAIKMAVRAIQRDPACHDGEQKFYEGKLSFDLYKKRCVRGRDGLDTGWRVLYGAPHVEALEERVIKVADLHQVPRF